MSEAVSTATDDEQSNNFVLPNLDVGDEIVVKPEYNFESNRTLTVEEVGTDEVGERVENGVALTSDEGGYVLSGYGTTYHLVADKSLSGAKRAFLVWKSTPEGTPISEVEVLSA